MECKSILLRKPPCCWFMHSLCKNENIPMWGKHRITKEIAFHLTRMVYAPIVISFKFLFAISTPS